MRTSLQRILAPLLLLLPLASCVGVSSRQFSSSFEDTVVAKRTIDGNEVTWRISSSVGDNPTLERSELRTTPTAYLGIRALDMDQGLALSSGLAPYRGVWVEHVEPGSAAARAGLRLGDVITSLGDVELTSAAQFKNAMRTEFEPDQAITARFQRFVEEKTYEPLEATVTLGSVESDAVTAETTSLRGSTLVRQLTGMQLGEFPADAASECFDSDSPTVLIAHVSPGGLAYRAGLRAGDRIVELDGAPVTRLDQVSGSVLARAREKGFEVASTSETFDPAPRTVEGPLTVEVAGRNGPYSTTFDVRNDLSSLSSVDIPILFECDSTAGYTNWSALDFIFQFGANYRSQYLPSVSRKPARSTFFSMLPFGFFEVEKRPGHARYCVLWFIEWTTNG
jgi:hypothetical protein